MKTIRIVLWVVVIVVAATTAGVYVGQTFLSPPSQSPAQGLAAAVSRSQYTDAGGPFRLIDTAGEAVTEKDLRGKPLAGFLGVTRCPEVCPTTLFDAHGWLEALGEDADKLQVAFISVDPERDTPDILGQYVKAFDDRILGLTARTEDEIAEVAERFKIRYEKVPLKNGDYTMNHTADMLLFDAEGTYAGFIPYMPLPMRVDETVAEREKNRVVDQLRELVAS